MFLPTLPIIKEWNNNNRQYLLKEFPPHKSVEIDFDGLTYLHLSLKCTPIQFTTLKKRLDDMFLKNGSSGTEYYYKGDVTILSFAMYNNVPTITLEINASSTKLLDMFIKWEPSMVNISDFLEKYCKSTK